MAGEKVIQIVRRQLAADGYGGLVNPDAVCGCTLDDLRPCAGDFADCEGGYKHMDPRQGREGEWRMFRQKDPPSLEQWGLLDD